MNSPTYILDRPDARDGNKDVFKDNPEVDEYLKEIAEGLDVPMPQVMKEFIANLPADKDPGYLSWTGDDGMQWLYRLPGARHLFQGCGPLPFTEEESENFNKLCEGRRLGLHKSELQPLIDKNEAALDRVRLLPQSAPENPDQVLFSVVLVELRKELLHELPKIEVPKNNMGHAAPSS